MIYFLVICLTNAVVASFLALIAAGVGRFCRRPALAHTLWVLVLLKLMTPPFFGVPLPLPAALVARVCELSSGHAGKQSSDGAPAVAYEQAAQLAGWDFSAIPEELPGIGAMPVDTN